MQESLVIRLRGEVSVNQCSNWPYKVYVLLHWCLTEIDWKVGFYKFWEEQKNLHWVFQAEEIGWEVGEKESWSKPEIKNSRLLSARSRVSPPLSRVVSSCLSSPLLSSSLYSVPLLFLPFPYPLLPFPSLSSSPYLISHIVDSIWSVLLARAGWVLFSHPSMEVGHVVMVCWLRFLVTITWLLERNFYGILYVWMVKHFEHTLYICV